MSISQISKAASDSVEIPQTEDINVPEVIQETSNPILKQKIGDMLNEPAEETLEAGSDLDLISNLLSLQDAGDRKKSLEALKKLPKDKQTLKSWQRETMRQILDKQKEIEKSLQAKPDIDMQEITTLRKQAEDWTLATEELKQIGLTQQQSNAIAKELLVNPETFIDQLEGIMPDLVKSIMKNKTLSKLMATNAPIQQQSNVFTDKIAKHLVSGGLIPDKDDDETQEQFTERAKDFYDTLFNKPVVSQTIDEESLANRLVEKLSQRIEKLEAMLQKPIEEPKKEEPIKETEKIDTSTMDFHKDKLQDAVVMSSKHYGVKESDLPQIINLINSDPEFLNLSTNINSTEYDIEKAFERIDIAFKKFKQSKVQPTTAPFNSSGNQTLNKEVSQVKGIRGIVGRATDEVYSGRDNF